MVKVLKINHKLKDLTKVRIGVEVFEKLFFLTTMEFSDGGCRFMIFVSIWVCRRLWLMFR